MDESYFKDKLSAYLDRSLPPEEMAMMEKYIEESEEARRILAEFEKLNKLVERYRDLGDDDYWEKSAQRIEQAIGLEPETEVTDISPQKGRRGLMWKIVAVAASAALLTIIGLHQDEIFHYEDSGKPQISPVIPKDEQPTVSDSLVTDRGQIEDQAEAGQGTPAETDLEISIDTAVPSALSSEPEELTAPSEGKSAISAPTTPEVTADHMAETPPLAAAESEQPSGQKTKITKSPTTTTAPEESATPQISMPTPVPPETTMAKSNYKSPPKGVSLGALGRPSESSGYFPPQSKSYTGEIKQSAKRTTAQAPAPAENVDSLLAFYRARRVEIESNLGQRKEQKSLNAFDKRPRSEEATVENTRKIELEKELITTCYEIARLTGNESEYKEVVGTIRQVAGDVNSPNMAMAEDYLKKLHTVGQ